jgi:hypothetical protein
MPLELYTEFRFYLYPLTEHIRRLNISSNFYRLLKKYFILLWRNKVDLFFFSGEGPRSRRYGHTTALRLLLQPVMKMMMMIIIFCPFPSNGPPVEWNWQGKTEALEEKPVPVPLCPPQMPHVLTRDRIRASAMGSRLLTAWALTRPGLFKICNFYLKHFTRDINLWFWSICLVCNKKIFLQNPL